VTVTATVPSIGRGIHAAAVPVLVRCAALLALMAVLPCAAAPEVGPRTNLQVTLWDSGMPGERRALTELVFSFQHANPDVIVCLEWKDAALQADWIPRWCDGYRDYAPDLTVMSEQYAWNNRHELLAMPDDLGRDLRREFGPSVMRRLPGQTRGVPWRVSTRALYYRSDLLAEAELDVPATLDELVACAAALAKPPARYGMGMPRPLGGGEDLLYALARAAGAVELADAADGPTLSDGSSEQRRNVRPDYERALELLLDMQSRGALQPETLTWSEAELVDLFAQGRLAMVIAPIWATRVLRAADEAPQWAVAPLPMAADGTGALAVDWLVTFEGTDRQENALRLMRYVAEKESQRLLAMMSGVPATHELVEEFGGMEPWSAHVAALGEADGVPLASWDRLRPKLADALIYALSGRLTPREALAEAVAIAQ